MAFDINEMKAQLTGGGARPSLFQVRILNAGDGSADLKLPFMVKTAQLPASNLSVINVPYFGRQIKEVGTRTFEPWSITVINDEDFLVRDAMVNWSRRINAHRRNTRGFGSSAPAEYKSRAEVVQYGQDGAIIKTYQFEGLFPTQVGAIELSWENGDAIEEFQVTFEYDYWEEAGFEG